MRQPRRIVCNARYHVVARANRGEFILERHGMKELLLATIARAHKKHEFRVENFCVMGNHVHMIVQPLRDSKLSRIMQWILSTFAINFNRIHHLRGHVWYDRFHSTVIETLKQYLQTFDYINMNPVKVGLAVKPTEYPYCGVRHILDGNFSVVDPPDFAAHPL